MTRTPFIPVIVAALILIAASGAYAAWFLLVQNESMHARTLAGEVENNRADAAQAAQQQEADAALAGDEQTIATHFVPTDSVVPFLETLQNMGKAYGAQVNVVSVAAGPSQTRGKLNLALQITGPYAAVAQTLGTLEYSSYDMELTTLTLEDSGSSAPGKADQWSAATTFSVGTGAIATNTAPAAPVAAPVSDDSADE